MVVFPTTTRHELAAESIAEIVTRKLRLRIAIVDKKDAVSSVSEIWRGGQTDDSGFEIVTVAALLAAGIPARHSNSGPAEYWNGIAWKPATRPAATPKRV